MNSLNEFGCRFARSLAGQADGYSLELSVVSPDPS